MVTVAARCPGSVPCLAGRQRVPGRMQRSAHGTRGEGGDARVGAAALPVCRRSLGRRASRPRRPRHGEGRGPRPRHPIMTRCLEDDDGCDRAGEATAAGPGLARSADLRARVRCPRCQQRRGAGASIHTVGEACLRPPFLSSKAPSAAAFLHHPIPPGERQRSATSLARSLLLRFAEEQRTVPLLPGRYPRPYGGEVLPDCRARAVRGGERGLCLLGRTEL
jgi:hypothetical protein